MNVHSSKCYGAMARRFQSLPESASARVLPRSIDLTEHAVSSEGNSDGRVLKEFNRWMVWKLKEKHSFLPYLPTWNAHLSDDESNSNLILRAMSQCPNVLFACLCIEGVAVVLPSLTV